MYSYLFLGNIAFIFISFWIASGNFRRGETMSGWFNLFASAVNFAIVLHIVTKYPL